MKKTVFSVILFFALTSIARTQVLKEFVIEPVPKDESVYSTSCDSPSNGILVFKSAIKELNISIYPTVNLLNINYNELNNEYVVCVKATTKRFRIDIRHAEYEYTYFFEDEALASDAKVYRVNPMQNDGTTRQNIGISQSNMTPTLSVLPASLSFASMGEQFDFEVSSNRNWTVNNVPDWLIVEPLSGSNNGAIKVTAAAHTGSTTRTATLAVRGPGVRVQNINITQSTPILDEIFENTVFVEGGTFSRGIANDWLGPEDQIPVHRVTVSDFYIGMYEVTQAQWRAIMGTTISQQRDKASGGISSNYYNIAGQGDKYPMYYVSWNEVQEFIRKLNTLTGKSFRLPTEAEWEYAARGGNKSNGYKFSGSNDANDVAWFNDNSGKMSHPVGTKSPNELGIFDMSGNVWEWCSDWYGKYSAGNKVNPKGPTTGYNRVIRGGCYGSYVTTFSSQELDWKYRNDWPPDQRVNATGFRLAYDVE